jgi:dTDP-4-dehydrorhamnose 3,5-epimerase
MKFTPLSIPECVLIEPVVFGDDRGFFMETYHAEKFRAAGIDVTFVQQNHSRSGRNTLRGLHYQIQNPQGKLVRVTAGEVFDVAVDMRRSSPTFGKWCGARLSAENKRQLYVPPGFAHGFCVVSESADFVYSCTDLYAPQHERSLLWNDPAVGIDWPIGAPLLSPRDAKGALLADAETYA